MTAFEAIQKAAKQIGIPAAPGLYEGKAEKYIVYNHALLRGDNFGDDVPNADIAEVQVHLYTPMENPKTHGKINYRADLDTLRNALFGYGFTYPEVTVLREEDVKKWHIVFECEYEEDEEDD